MPHAELQIGCPATRIVVFLPGFLTSASAYRGLLAPLTHGDTCVRIVQMYPPGLRALAGRPTVVDEARAAAAVVAGLVADGHEVWLAGHSRGGQAAWLAAEQCSVGGLVVIDPVDGAGPGSKPRTTARPARFDLVPLIVGAGLAGRCAPPHRNHERFAAACPRRIHAVLPECGHIDILEPGLRQLGRLLCRQGRDPEGARRTVTALMAAHLEGRLARAAGPKGAPAPGSNGVPAQTGSRAGNPLPTRTDASGRDPNGSIGVDGPGGTPMADPAWPSRVVWR